MRKYRKPYKAKRGKSIFRNRFFWLGILILIIFGGFFYFLIFSSTFQIKEIKISGNSRLEIKDFQRDKQKVSIVDIRELIEKEIEGKVLFLPTKSIFLANLNKINEIVLERFPQIARVNLNREFPDILLVQIEERKPVAIFKQNEHWFFIDEEGIIFEEFVDVDVRRQHQQIEAESQKPKIKNLTLAKEARIGERVVEKGQLPEILEIESKLRENFKIPIKEVLIVSDERVNFKTLEGWEIYLNPQEDTAWQLTKLRVVLEEEIPLENRKDLEYIELRFGNFAPYKYKD